MEVSMVYFSLKGSRAVVKVFRSLDDASDFIDEFKGTPDLSGGQWFVDTMEVE